MHFQQTHNQRFASVIVDSVLVPPRLAQHPCWCPYFSVVPEVTYEASPGPLKGAVSVLGGMEENSVSLMRG